MHFLGILSNHRKVKLTRTLQVSAESLIAEICVSAGQIQSSQQLMAQENKGRLPDSSDITLPEVTYLGTGLEKAPNN